VFREIFVSFLPVGHTHFDPDQLASRLAQAAKYSDILSLEGYIEIITQCYAPSPVVVVVDGVMDTKSLFNPGLDIDFPLRTARCLRTRGCSTLSVDATRTWFMGPTSALHWRMRRVVGGKAVIQVKQTCDDVMWSAAFYPWTTAPRPDFRAFEEGFSGLLPSDITMTAPSKVMKPTRTTDLRLALDNVQTRLSADQWAEVQVMFEKVSTPTVAQPLPEGFGKFVKEDAVLDHVPVADGGLMARQHAVYETQHQQNAARELRRTQGHASEALVIGNYIAYPPNYTADTHADEKNDFWVGRIISVNVPLQCVNVRRLHTGTKKNLTNVQAMYRLWTGNTYTTEEVGIECVLETFQLTDGNRINAARRRHIGQSLTLYETNQIAMSQPIDLGVGHDIAENPAGRAEDDIAENPAGRAEE